MHFRLAGVRQGLQARVEVPGDKSISHRALMLGAIAEGTTRVSNFLGANDCMATLQCVRDLGIEVEEREGDLWVHGRGLEGLRQATGPLYCGGSGTTMRLLAGLLAGQMFRSVLTGNAQLSRRPMDRVALPLREMGARITGSGGEGRYPPLEIRGVGLRGITYRLPVASAQVKSAILLAGLFAEGTTIVEEPVPTRDHTERMLRAMGADIRAADGAVSVLPSRLTSLEITVPGDPSSAAFPLAAAALLPGSSVYVPRVSVNPGRAGFLTALARMGAVVEHRNGQVENGEPVADLAVSYGSLTAISVGAEDVPGMIDELPLLAVVATQAEGVSEVRGAAELRVKETDRIATTVSELGKMGADIEALPDGFRVRGPVRLRGARVSSHGDHRLAMALSIAALCAQGESVVEDTACVADSFPGFERLLEMLIAPPQGPG